MVKMIGLKNRFRKCIDPYFRKILNYTEKKDPISSLIESIIHLTVTLIKFLLFQNQ